MSEDLRVSMKAVSALDGADVANLGCLRFRPVQNGTKSAGGCESAENVSSRRCGFGGSR
jgi:hypothetical protein